MTRYYIIRSPMVKSDQIVDHFDSRIKYSNMSTRQTINDKIERMRNAYPKDIIMLLKETKRFAPKKTQDGKPNKWSEI